MTIHCYLVIIRREKDRYIARCADLPDCSAAGATFDEAHQRLITAMRAAVRHLQETGQPVPESLDIEDYRYGWPELSSESQTAFGLLFSADSAVSP